MRPAPAGFTLAELVAVLAVTGVLLALAMPEFIQFNHHVRTRSASHLLGTSLAGARVRAVMGGIPVNVCPVDGLGNCRDDGVWDLGWRVFRNPTRAPQPVRPDDVLENVEPAPGLRIRSSVGRGQARFLPDGRSSGSNLTLTVCSTHPGVSGARLIVSNGGRLRTERVPAGHPDCPGA